VFDDLGMQTF